MKIYKYQMNLIGNNCVSADVYSAGNIIYNNPFIYMYICSDDYYKLINNFDNINLSNVVFDFEQHNGNNTIIAIIENSITLHFIHHSDINYVKNAYFRRLNRFKGLKTKPIFMWWIDYNRLNESEYNRIIKLINTITNPIVLFINENRETIITNNLITIIKLPNDLMYNAFYNTKNAGIYLFEKYKNILTDDL